MNPWIYLIIAGLSEIIWAISMELSDGFSKLVPSIITIVFLIVSMIFLSMSLKDLPIGIAYACWTAIGAVGVAIIGMLFLGESKSIIKFVLIAIIVACVSGLKSFS